MRRVIVKHTFLAFEEGESATASSRRSKSADARREEDEQEEDEEAECAGLARLNCLLWNDLASSGHTVAPLPSAARGASVEELRRLQEKLREVAGAGKLSKVSSMGSVCTMVPEDGDLGALRSSLRNVGSSGSVSSMVSESCWEDGVGADTGPCARGNAAIVRCHLPAPAPCQLRTARAVADTRPAPAQARALQQAQSSLPGPKDYWHSQVPKRCNLAEDFAKAELKGPPTTLMIRNIPNHYTHSHMACELEALGFQNSYDFLYVPIDKGTMGSVGYCFVNFVSPAWASRCAQVFEGRPFDRCRQNRRGKVAAVSVAHLQGLEANLRHYKNAVVSSPAKAGKGSGPVVIASLASALGQQ